MYILTNIEQCSANYTSVPTLSKNAFSTQKNNLCCKGLGKCCDTGKLGTTNKVDINQ